MNFFKAIFSEKKKGENPISVPPAIRSQEPAAEIAEVAVPIAEHVPKSAKLEEKAVQSSAIYLDYASVTPVDPRILDMMHECSKELYANPSSLYAAGVRASKKLGEARERVARCLEVQPAELYFTSGGTESNNLALRGFFSAIISNVYFRPHIITSTVEHPSVLEVLKDMSRSGICEVTFVPVLESGIIDMKEFKAALKRETVLVTIQYANNEVGTIQPVQEIAKAIRHFRKGKPGGTSADEVFEKTLPMFHTDACQAPSYLSLRVPALGIDLMTLDSSKFYGPRGAGLLYAKKGIKLRPLMFGGAQEEYVRPGTEPLANIVGFAEALEECQKNREAESMRIASLRDNLLKHLLETVPALKLNGDEKERLPNNINVCMPGMDAEFCVIRLDAQGVAASSVTSCRSKKEDSSSYVVAALGRADCAKSSLRLTLGKYTTESEVERAKPIISQVLTTML